MPRRKKATKLTKAIGERIHALRCEKGLTLQQVGEVDDAGNLKGHVSNIEHGRVNLTLEMLAKIAENLDVELPFLVTLPDASPRQALVARICCMPLAEVDRLLAEFGPIPVLVPRPIKRARNRPVEKERKAG